jgi:CysZ protein
MALIQGILYNIRGLLFGIKSGKLLFWGLLRFVFIIIITIISAGLILAHHREILDLIWARPASMWVLWLWQILSWFLSLILVGFAAILSYLISQILFSVIIMDHMSRITERMVTGQVKESEGISHRQLFFSLIREEIPRAIIPVLLSLLLMILSWFVALGPLFIILSPALAVIFLAWDNTDLLPARRLSSFKSRFGFLLKTLLFHLGFGLLFLIPGLNLLFLAFAPVGGTLYHLDEKSPLSAR